MEVRLQDLHELSSQQRLNDKISISLADRLTILGWTGSGKTTFARAFLPVMNHLYPGVRNYILDSKGYGEFDDFAALPGATLIVDQQAPRPLNNPGGIQIWKPPLNNLDEYDKWFGYILTAQKPCVILLDEIASLATRRGTEFPPNFVLLLKQGRIMDECVISMTQEYGYMERNIFGQMTHFLRFNLINRYDLRESNKLMGFPERDLYRNPHAEHGFFYRRMNRPSAPAYEYTGYQEFLY